MELSGCQMRTSETQKAHQKSERKIKELQFQVRNFGRGAP
jgi:hypothetical protein